jgi:hypothetical protein
VERLLRRMAGAHIVGLSLSLVALASLAVAWFDKARPAGSPGVIALQLAFSEEAFHGIITQWGVEGVQAYRRSTLYIDSWFPLAYASLLSSVIAVLTVRAGGTTGRFQLARFALPSIASLWDWVENTLHLILLRDPSHLSATLVLIASIAAAIKWDLIALSIAAILCLLLRMVGARRRGTSPH